MPELIEIAEMDVAQENFLKTFPVFHEYLLQYYNVPVRFHGDIFELMYEYSETCLYNSLFESMCTPIISCEHEKDKFRFTVNKNKCHALFFSCFLKLFKYRKVQYIANKLYDIIKYNIETPVMNTLYFWNVKIQINFDTDIMMKTKIKSYVFNTHETSIANNFIATLYARYSAIEQSVHEDAVYNFDYDEYLDTAGKYASFMEYIDDPGKRVYPGGFGIPIYDNIGIIATVQRIIKLVEIGILIDAVPWNTVDASEIIINTD